MPRCERTNPRDRKMQCTAEAGHEGDQHRLGGIAWRDSDQLTHREFWTQDGNGRDMLIGITFNAEEAQTVWDAAKRARSFVIEREHQEHRYKGRFVRGWSEDDGYFYAESPDDDPGSKHREAARG